MKKIFAVLLAVLMTISAFTAGVYAEEFVSDMDKTAMKAVSYILENGGSDWEVLAISRSNVLVEDYTMAENYCKSIAEKLDSQGSPILSGNENTLTDNSKAVLALTSLGVNCRNINGYDIVEPLSNMEGIKAQGVNSAVYALIALDSAGYTTSDPKTRTNLLDYILSQQMENGAWAYSQQWSPNGDVDLTAMAVQALAPYVSSSQQAKEAVELAVTYMSQEQQENGGYMAYGSESCESTAQVIIALTSLGINPCFDQRFIKAKGNTLDNLLSFAKEEGGFSHTKEGEVNAMTTVQALLAMDALQLNSAGRTLYGMTNEYIFSASVNTAASLTYDGLLQYGSEWIVFALARIDESMASPEMFGDYVQSVKDTIAQTGPVLNTGSGYLTDNARVIIALTSLGIDCTDIDGVNIVEPLSNIEKIKEQGVNSAIYALLALNTAMYSTSDSAIREKLVDYILDERLENGTWAYSVIWSPNGDIDLTAMAVQALAPYLDTDEKVKEAVDTAMAFLKDQQSQYGYYISFGSPSSSSTAQVVCALQELGRNSMEDEEFTVDNVSLAQALLAFVSNDGGFSSSIGSGSDKFSSTQCMYALSSIIRTLSGKTSLYDMTDVLDKSHELPEIPDNPETAYGDVDGNGITNIDDVTIVQKYIAGMETLFEELKAVADVNGDGSVDISDVTNIQKYIAGLPYEKAA